MKLELILRLLDNDELSPEQVNDVKDFLEDYVERNQVCGTLHFTFVSSASLKKIHIWHSPPCLCMYFALPISDFF